MSLIFCPNFIHLPFVRAALGINFQFSECFSFVLEHKAIPKMKKNTKLILPGLVYPELPCGRSRRGPSSSSGRCRGQNLPSSPPRNQDVLATK